MTTADKPGMSVEQPSREYQLEAQVIHLENERDALVQKVVALESRLSDLAELRAFKERWGKLAEAVEKAVFYDGPDGMTWEYARGRAGTYISTYGEYEALGLLVERSPLLRAALAAQEAARSSEASHED